jgi:ABC-type lipoprotein export system ATPase subunit
MIEVSGITFGYGAENPVLNDWSAAFHPGELTGPSGRGKSTLLYLIGLMLRPASGEIRVGGVSAAGLSDSKRALMRATLFGFVFQDAALDPTRTVLDNVIETAIYRAEPRRFAKVRALELMTRLGVELRASAKPGQVSGGQAQRIALCRALLNDPEVLLADEPTGNLDSTSSELVVDVLREQAGRGAAVIVVTHDPLLVARCDRQVKL